MFDQVQPGYGMPQIRCKIHQSSFLEYINLNIDSNNLLFCLKCAESNGLKLNENKSVIMQEIFSKSSQNFIKNWPPLQSQKLCEWLNSKDVQEDKRSEQISKINLIFDQLRTDIVQIIDNHEKKIIEHVNMIEDNRQNIFILYNQISQKEEIKAQIFNKQSNLKELEDYLRNLILVKQNQSHQNEQLLKDSQQNLTKSQQKLSFEHIANLIEQISQNLTQINFLNPMQQNTFENNVQFNQLQFNDAFKTNEKTQFVNPFQQNTFENKVQFDQLQFNDTCKTKEKTPFQNPIQQNNFTNNVQFNQKQFNDGFKTNEKTQFVNPFEQNTFESNVQFNQLQFNDNCKTKEKTHQSKRQQENQTQRKQKDIVKSMGNRRLRSFYSIRRIKVSN